MAETDLTEDELLAYRTGFLDGLAAYAINRDGSLWVGSPERKLSDAKTNAANTWCYFPRKEKT